MERPINANHDKNQDIASLINKLAKSKDIDSYNNRIMKYIEENNKRILISIKNDKKSFLLLTRTYYLNEFNKITKFIDNEERLNNNLTNEKYIQLLSFLNILIKFEDYYINKEDIFKSLQLQSKIINIIKKYFINKI